MPVTNGGQNVPGLAATSHLWAVPRFTSALWLTRKQPGVLWYTQVLHDRHHEAKSSIVHTLVHTVQEVWDSPQRFSSGTSTVGFTTESGSCILVYVHWYPFHANGALSGEKSHPIHHEGAERLHPNLWAVKCGKVCVENEISVQS